MPSLSSAGGPFVLRRFIHIELTCDHCGRVFFRRRSAVRGGRTYCDTACKNLGQRQSVTVTCRTCGAARERSPSRIRNGGLSFCDLACMAVWQQAHPPRQVSSPEALLARHTAKSATCWRWTGHIIPGGYGRTTVGGGWSRGGKLWTVHRLAWTLVAGPIPKGMGVYHTCDVRNCLRNDDEGTYEVKGVLHPRRGHLWIGTTQDNLDDMYAKGRGPTGTRHGSQTHPERVPRGEASGVARWTDDQIREIRQAYAVGGITIAALARQHEMSESQMRRVVWRQSRRDLE